MYHPKQALRNAINDWLPEFAKHKTAWGPIAKPQPAVAVVPLPIIPSINTCMSLTSTTSTTSTCSTTIPLVNSNQLQALAEVCSTVSSTDSMVNPLPGPVMNSLVSETKVICNESIPNPITPVAIPIPIDNAESKTVTILSGTILKADKVKQMNNTEGGLTTTAKEKQEENTMNTDTSLSTESSLSPSEPMDCNSTPNISPAHVAKAPNGSNEDVAMSENSASSGSMQVDGSQMVVENNDRKVGDLTYEDLALLCDLFYLPFEHGGQGLQFLQEFNWLKSNAHLVIEANNKKDSNPEVQEWYSRAEKMNELSKAVDKLGQHMTNCNNRELLYELYSYMWDIRSVISLLNSYIKWLANGWFPTSMQSYTQGTYTWFSKGWKETFMSGEQEPWVFRGGLTADLQRLIPVDSGNDLFVYKIPEVPSNRVFTIRPYIPCDDEKIVYSVCTKTCKDGLEDPVPYPEALKDLQADRIVGPYLTLHPEFCLVVEDDAGVVGYACAAPDHKKFLVKQEVAWVGEMREKYPKERADGMHKFAQEAVSYFHNFKEDDFVSIPTHPSSMICSLLPSVLDQSVSKRLVTCLLAALRANGSFGVHVVMNITDSYTHAFYGKLGFVENTQETIKGKIVMGRTF
ncbi:unnamed protein product [Phaedon cochleariae]|uniref:Bifunctional protein NCOAT n=1 Tax=Phaedon cochleariae TaxID=80249 RepID=A0A9P0DQW8_PHACE|nr:unnamed protein product [Phaedon cochleariae]